MEERSRFDVCGVCKFGALLMHEVFEDQFLLLVRGIATFESLGTTFSVLETVSNATVLQIPCRIWLKSVVCVCLGF